MNRFDGPSKAVAGAVVAVATALIAVLSDGALSWPDVAAVAIAGAGGYLGVWIAPKNVPAQRRRRDRRPTPAAIARKVGGVRPRRRRL